jgi:glycosyltransferase involved in cell wall biosynthesis
MTALARCPYCGGDAIARWRRRGDGREVLRCDECDLRFVRERDGAIERRSDELPVDRRAELALVRLFGRDGEASTAWESLEAAVDLRAAFSELGGSVRDGTALIVSAADCLDAQAARQADSWIGFRERYERVSYLTPRFLERALVETVACAPLFVSAGGTLFAITRKGGLSDDDRVLHRALCRRDVAAHPEVAWFWVLRGDPATARSMVAAARAARHDVALLDAIAQLREGRLEAAAERLARLPKSDEVLQWLCRVTAARLAAAQVTIRRHEEELASLLKRVDTTISERDAAREEARLLRVSAGYRIGRSLTRVLERMPLAETVWRRIDAVARQGIGAALPKQGSPPVAHPPRPRRYIPVDAGLTRDLVSVVLPVYNQANLLIDGIESVLAQTYPRFELIVVNDGSTDGVEAVLDRYVGHPKVRILTQRNLGLPRALSNGFDVAQGEFWTWTSADNRMSPFQLERLVTFLRSRPEVDMTYADYRRIGDNGLPLPVGSELHLPRDLASLNTGRDNYIGPCFLYRGHVGLAIGDYDPTVGVEDYDYWMRINSLFRIEHLGTDELLYEYRVHDNSLTGRMSEAKIRDRTERLASYDEQRRRAFAKPLPIAFDGESRALADRLRSPRVEIVDATYAGAVRLVAGDCASGDVRGPAIVWFGAGSTAPYRCAALLAAQRVVAITDDDRVLARVHAAGGRGFCDEELAVAFDVAVTSLVAGLVFDRTHEASLRSRVAPDLHAARAVAPSIAVEVPDDDVVVAAAAHTLIRGLTETGAAPFAVRHGDADYEDRLQHERVQLVIAFHHPFDARLVAELGIPMITIIDRVDPAQRPPPATCYVASSPEVASRLDASGIDPNDIIVTDRIVDLADWIITGGAPRAARRWLAARSRGG